MTLLKAGRPTVQNLNKGNAISKVNESPKRFNVSLPNSLHKKVKAKAALEGLSLKQLAIELLSKYLNE